MDCSACLSCGMVVLLIIAGCRLFHSYAILDPADRQNLSSIVFPVSENICRHKIRGPTIFLRESMIICSELFNMGRIGNFVIFKPHFDNVPEFPRLYTFSMSYGTPRLTKNR